MRKEKLKKVLAASIDKLKKRPSTKDNEKLITILKTRNERN